MAVSFNRKQALHDAAQMFRLFRKNQGDNLAKHIKKGVSGNPFLLPYLASLIDGGTVSARGIAQAIVLPRALGVSASTSFGTRLQKYVVQSIPTAGASSVSGFDIVFFDHVDGYERHAQLKLGPDTINKGDVASIQNELAKAYRLERTNGGNPRHGKYCMGVLYGQMDDLNGHYLAINQDHPVIVGKDLWHRITGDQDFYNDLAAVFEMVSKEKTSGTNSLEDALQSLSEDASVKAFLAQLRKSAENI